MNPNNTQISMYSYLEFVFFFVFVIMHIQQNLLQVLTNLYGYSIDIPNISHLLLSGFYFSNMNSGFIYIH
jgi:hypothetical protein